MCASKWTTKKLFKFSKITQTPKNDRNALPINSQTPKLPHVKWTLPHYITPTNIMKALQNTKGGGVWIWKSLPLWAPKGQKQLSKILDEKEGCGPCGLVANISKGKGFKFFLKNYQILLLLLAPLILISKYYTVYDIWYLVLPSE